MARHTWDPMRDLLTLQDRMNRLFEDAADRRGRNSGGEGEAEDEMERADWSPAADVYEREAEYVIVLDLPGVERERLDVGLDENRLTIRGERARGEMEDAQARRAERPAGRFVRSFTLPETVERGRVSADYKDGVLRLRLPKRREQQPPRRVEIKIT